MITLIVLAAAAFAVRIASLRVRRPNLAELLHNATIWLSIALMLMSGFVAWIFPERGTRTVMVLVLGAAVWSVARWTRSAAKSREDNHA